MKLIKFAIGCLLVFSTSSCKKWLDINSDPSKPQLGQAEYLLSPIQAQMAINTAIDYKWLFKYTQFWGNQAAKDVWEQHGYDVASDNGGYIWKMTYFSLGKNLEEMIADGVTNQKYAYAGIGYAIKAWAYQVTTDYHGPAILDEAYDPTKLTFHYADQPEVYAKVREWAFTALNYLSRTDGKDYSTVLAGASGDQMYQGDLSKWKKFVYGLLALQYSHLRNKPDFTTKYADSVIKYVDLSFTNEQEDARINFTGSNAGDSNPFGTSGGPTTVTPITSTAYARVSQTIVSALTGGVRGTAAVSPTSSVDPRLTRMIASNPDGVYRGIIPTQGDPNSTKRVPNVLGSVAAPFPGKYLFADKAKFIIMTYSQLQFAKAEAYYAKSALSEAYDAYLKGIEGHMDFVNRYGLNGTTASPAITAAEITAYKASSEVAQSATELTMADIMGQKFIAQWGWAGIEEWCDLRKYHYDPTVFRFLYQLAPSEINLANNGKLAYRVRPRYNSEYVWNRDELAKWGGLNPDYQTYEMWFSKPE